MSDLNNNDLDNRTKMYTMYANISYGFKNVFLE